MIQDMMEQVYIMYKEAMMKVAYSILNNYQQAEDAVQDAFIKLSKYLPGIDDVYSDKTKHLVLTVIRNVSIDKYRKNKRENELFTGMTEIGYEMVSSDNQEFLNNILKKLTPSQREIVKLKCYFNLDYGEIAERLNLKEATVRKRFSRAKKVILNIGGEFSEEYRPVNVLAGQATSIK